MLPAGDAVEVFFMLSGFYMAIILDQTYRGPGSYGIFIRNRVLRLYPIYAVVLVLTVAVGWYVSVNGYLPDGRVSVVSGAWWVAPDFLTPFGALLIVILHVTLIGQELPFLFQTSSAGLMDVVTWGAQPELRTTYAGLQYYLLVPQAWSLGLEMLFYLLAPALVRSRLRTVTGVWAASLGVRTLLQVGTGLMTYNFFAHQFFPLELWTFATGILGYRFYVAIRGREYPPQSFLWAPILLVTLIAGYQYIPFLRNWTLFACAAVLIPCSFHAIGGRTTVTSKWRFLSAVDAYLGDLSYPVYISHILVMYGMYMFMSHTNRHWSLAAITLTLIVSAILLVVVQGPIDRIRVRNRASIGARPSRAERHRAERRRAASGRSGAN